MPDPAVWGDVATWVTGFATVATFGLGYRILSNDRRREIRKQAAAIVCWCERDQLSYVFDNDPHEKTVQVVVLNNSDHPVTRPLFWAVGVSEKELRNRVGRENATAWMQSGSHSAYRSRPWDLDGRPEALDPGARVETGVELANGVVTIELFLQFVDVSGVTWRRNVRTNELILYRPPHWKDSWWRRRRLRKEQIEIENALDAEVGLKDYTLREALVLLFVERRRQIRRKPDNDQSNG